MAFIRLPLWESEAASMRRWHASIEPGFSSPSSLKERSGISIERIAESLNSWLSILAQSSIRGLGQKVNRSLRACMPLSAVRAGIRLRNDIEGKIAQRNGRSSRDNLDAAVWGKGFSRPQRGLEAKFGDDDPVILVPPIQDNGLSPPARISREEISDPVKP